MPLYEYECKQCRQRLEKIQSFSAPHETICPRCGGELERVISAPAIQFKGAGWYVNDYAKSGSKAPSSGDSANKSDGKADLSAAASDSKADSNSKPVVSTSDSAPSSSDSSPATSNASGKTSSTTSSGSNKKADSRDG